MYNSYFGHTQQDFILSTSTFRNNIKEIKTVDLDSIFYKTSVFSRLVNNSAGTMFSDIASDSLWNGKFTLSAAMGVGKNDTIKDIQAFLVGGGNLTLRANFRLLGSKNKNLGLFFYPKISFNIPPVNNNTYNTPTGNVDVGMEGHFNYFTKKNKFGFLGKFRSAITYSTNNLSTLLTKNQRKFFGYGQMTIGILIFEKLIISYSSARSFFDFNTGNDDFISSYSASYIF